MRIPSTLMLLAAESWPRENRIMSITIMDILMNISIYITITITVTVTIITIMIIINIIIISSSSSMCMCSIMHLSNTRKVGGGDSLISPGQLPENVVPFAQ